MTRTELMGHLSEVLKCDPSELGPDTRFGDHPKWDSMAHVQIMLFLSEKFNFEVSDETISKYGSVKAIEELLESSRHDG